MTNDEINRYIHEEIMGECWHDWHITSSCTKCGDGLSRRAIPGYCSDDSPRRLLNEVVAKLRERSGTPYPYITALDQIVHGEWTLASAEQIARACVEAHKESGK